MRRAGAVVAGLLWVLVLALAGCGVVTGSGRTTTASRTVAGFDKVELSGSGTLELTQTGTESLTIEADEQVLPRLTSDVVGGTLRLGVRPGTAVLAASPVTYRLTVATLSGLVVTGSGDVRAARVDTPRLDTRITGSGSVRVSGSAGEQDLAILGSGAFDGSSLQTRTMHATISGSGDAKVQVSDTLDVKISGSGTLAYTGHPQVVRHVTGSGDVRPA